MSLSFLGEAWFDRLRDELADLPEQSGVDGTIHYVVNGTPHGKVQFRVAYADGRVDAIEAGKGDADVVITWKYPEAVAVFSGERDPDVAFMQGRTKVEGDYARYLLGLRPVLDGPEHRAALERLSADTEY